MTERERLRVLVDDLPEDAVHPALRFLEFLRSAAPTADEPVTAGEPDGEAEAAPEGGRKGRIISHEGMQRRVFGER